MNDKPYSVACERNRQPICLQLQKLFAASKRILEIGSGTGQHAVHFASQMPHLQWQCSDLAENHQGINDWIDAQPAENIHRPVILDVSAKAWPQLRFDAVFTANTCHIMSMNNVQAMFSGVAQRLPTSGLFVVYGPFKFKKVHTSSSNAAFDQQLKIQNPQRGIRDFEQLDQLATERQLRLTTTIPMPANNYLLCWQKTDSE